MEIPPWPFWTRHACAMRCSWPRLFAFLGAKYLVAVLPALLQIPNLVQLDGALAAPASVIEDFARFYASVEFCHLGLQCCAIVTVQALHFAGAFAGSAYS